MVVKGALHAKQSNTALSARQFTGACFLASFVLLGPAFAAFATCVFIVLVGLAPSAPIACALAVLSTDSFALHDVSPLFVIVIGEPPGNTGFFARKDAVSFLIYLQSKVIKIIHSDIIKTSAREIPCASGILNNNPILHPQ